MKKPFHVTLLLVLFPLLAIVISGFGAPRPAPATPVVPVAPANQPKASSPDLQGISAAFAKTKTATAFRIAEKLSGSGTIVQLLPNMPDNLVLLGAEGEFKGKDSHVKLTGLAGMLWGDDPVKGIEVTRIGDKTYVHGPSSALNALEDQWYALDSNSGFTLNFSLSDSLDQLAAANGDWARFQKSRSESFDGKKCDVYSAGKEAAGDTLAAVSQSILMESVADSGNIDLWI